MLKCVGAFLIVSLLTPLALAKERYQQPGPIHLDRDRQKWAEKTLHKLSSEETVGQLFMIWGRAQFWNTENPDYLKLRDNIHKHVNLSLALSVPVDGPFPHRNQPIEAAVLLNRLQK